MRYFLLVLFLVSPFNLFPEEETPSLLEALQTFYENNGGKIEDLNFNKEDETQIEESLKAFLIDLAKEQSKDSNDLDN